MRAEARKPRGGVRCVLSVREGLQAQGRPAPPCPPDARGEARREDCLSHVWQNFPAPQGHAGALSARTVRVEAWQKVD